ncbi:tetratricopeptide repeat protein [Desulfovibrio sp. JC022]|uniref:tetratricopeptide repeat protein n=1 Tax=Desulfovibrio sp. JC022 TaxID=2593642 RepID=UPI0013D74868|nr:tetratricopeptide repeat protein [Desulfovibrio sp. JC022]NDV22752.1 tetratricopeptide repeat protein [Desulfovibrio sp. JC022]
MSSALQVLGIYSKNVKAYTGAGTTMQRSAHTTYYYVLRGQSDVYHIQPLNQERIPSGLFTKVLRDEFIAKFSPEMGYYQNTPLEELEILKELLLEGPEIFSPEAEDGKIQELVRVLLLNPGEKNLPANKEAHARLSAVIEVLFTKNETFVEEQRQDFNDSGISLRKRKKYDEALTFYIKALEINPDDENLYFNIARSYYETGNKEEALVHIEKALKINPLMEVAILFKKYLLKTKKKKAKPKPITIEPETE